MKVKEAGKRSLLREAGLRFDTAERAFKGKNYAFAFRQAQECVELALKSALRRVGVEYPRKHDVSPALRRCRERFPEWFGSEIEKFCEISTQLAGRRGLSMYGDEARGLAPAEIFGKADAERAVGQARGVLAACKRLYTKTK